MDKATKCCELTVYLKSGHRMTGLFHVSARTSSTIRPSDALLEKNNGLLLLSDVTLFENNIPRRIDAVMVPIHAISHLELPSGWVTRGGSDGAGESHARQPAPITSSQSPSSRRLVGGS